MILEIKMQPYDRTTTFGELPVKALFKMSGCNPDVMMKCENGIFINLSKGMVPNESEILNSDPVIPATKAQLIVEF